MASGGITSNDSRCLRQFLQGECCWREVGRGLKFREFQCIACRSAIFSVEGDNACMACQLYLFKRGGENIICFACNGHFMGVYSCPRVQRMRQEIVGLPATYKLLFLGPLGPARIDFVPGFSPMMSVVPRCSITPQLIYDVCTLVPPEEAERIRVKGCTGSYEPGVEKAISLGGAGAWLVNRSGGYALYFYLLCYDLFTVCGNNEELPSMARLMALATACGQMGCNYCKDHGGHIDPTGCYVGCIPDRGNCLCYTLCNSPSMNPITNENPVAFFCDVERATYLCSVGSKSKGKITLAEGLDYHIGAKNADGDWVPLNANAWQLVKLEDPIARMIVCACPVLKNLVH
ncbi:UL94 [Papio ursinus cytomegalovirus]|uniref:UL94 n=1 Tax=Papiine betaherpesvirus 4 TaxID=2560624 RepID=A0A0F7GA46_9BETA|nr:UL94 [Papio ursinus cytomegalovirus]AKG51633.1 UL94 [Papiine betaherpesvirus 4]